MKTRESMENYLETIYLLEQRTGYVRAIDIATELGFSKPSVSNAMKKLRAEGYISVEEKSRIVLTPEGRRIAEGTYERHCVIAAALMRIGVSEETALQDACRMEHILSEETFLCMKRHHEASLRKSEE
ncbi:metal-dependent transcriptional regulator [Anaerotignum lactatifermentans]|uniref:Metal-dependent transcriptional regulator n=1 Tax=Anaerotignum lactatifermentans TaxID=160404 RepID=A0ABS2GB03_9FIRM|nr:metal-dependent transcriptional regulator [Anaerotignum lactatifermentans]MBM6829563.1 metal-dependent transcriptional regulator [Anaerotignum lactatifermentans]MBM6878057.1 metal-dependent transcriptional regulator [Anaerotignum lactatifermentans]MBM6951113.1 metal-dependent transcriptional regulator [Anaerotignum lactatifermentans]